MSLAAPALPSSRPILAPALRRLGRSSPVRYAPVFAVLALLLLWPLVMLAVGSFRTAAPGFPGDWSLAAWGEAFRTKGMGEAVRNSFLIAFVTTAIATVIAAGLAFLSERTDAPFRRWITPALVVMFATPPVFYAVGYALLGNAYTGLFNQLARIFTGTPGLTVIDIETMPGLLTVTALRKVAVAYLFLIGPFRALDPSHDEASFTAGAGVFETFWRINLPILAPALTGAVLMGIVIGLQAFDIIAILGWPQDIQVITTKVFDFITLAARPDYAKASVVSICLLGVIAALCAIQARILGTRSFFTVGGKARQASRLALGAWRWPVGAAILAYLFAGAIAPIASVAFSSLQPFPGVYDRLSFDNYAQAFSIQRVVPSLITTLALSLSVGLAGMILAVLSGQASRTGGPRTAAAIRFATFIPLAMPGVVTALAIAWAFVSTPGLQQLYGTIYLTGLALVACVIPYASQVASAALSQVAPELQEAARISGASGPRALLDVSLRLIAPSFLIGWFMTAILASGNLEVPLLLDAPGQRPIISVVYDLNNRGDFSIACALLMVTLLTKAAVGLGGYFALKSGSAFARRKLAARAIFPNADLSSAKATA